MAYFSWQEGKPTTNTHLLNGTTNLLRDSQVFDADLGAVMDSFPHVGETTKGDRVITNSCEIA